MVRVKDFWLHPDLGQWSPSIRAAVEQARRFSVLSFGATVVYNVMLCEAAIAAGLPIAQAVLDTHRATYAAWADEYVNDLPTLRWDLDDLWAVTLGHGHQIGIHTRVFMEMWASRASADPRNAVNDPIVHRAITARERSLKGSLARLSSPKALERYAGSAGLGRLSYRWPNVRTIVQDIQLGLAGERTTVDA